jgi:hypothetical protein
MNSRSNELAGGDPSTAASPTGTTLRVLCLAFLIMFSSLLAGVSFGLMGGGIMLLPAILFVWPIAFIQKRQWPQLRSAPYWIRGSLGGALVGLWSAYRFLCTRARGRCPRNETRAWTGPALRRRSCRLWPTHERGAWPGSTTRCESGIILVDHRPYTGHGTERLGVGSRNLQQDHHRTGGETGRRSGFRFRRRKA